MTTATIEETAEARKTTAPHGTWGLLAEFPGPDALKHGAKATRRTGVTSFDVHTPYPVHGMDEAMGLGRSKLGWIVLCCAILGCSVGFGLQTFTSVFAYPLITAGKPYFSWQAFIPVTFELTVLFSAFGTVIGMLCLNRLPNWYHPALKNDDFLRASNDKFFLSVESKDALFDGERMKSILLGAGAVKVHELEY